MLPGMITPALSRLMRTTLREVSPEGLALVASAYMVLFCNARFWTETFQAVRPDSPMELVFVCSLPLVLTALYFLLLLVALTLMSRRALKPLLIVLFLLNALALYFIDTYHVYIDHGMLRNALQTDWRESSELLSGRMFVYLLLFGILPAVALRLFRLRRDSLWRVLARRSLLLVAILAVVAGVTAGLSQQYVFFVREHRELRLLMIPVNYLVAAASFAGAGADHLTGPDIRQPIGTDAKLGYSWQAVGRSRPVLLVLVVGETARAAQFSLNGYPRTTNPLLAERQVFNFPDVHSCGTSTAVSLPCMFRPFGKDGPDADELRHYESLLDVVQRAGPEVLWLDNNSGCKGVCAGVESRPAGGQGDPTLCNADGCYDEVLVRELAGVLTGSPRSRLVVLHQNGSHGPAYYHRYPESFGRFSPDCRRDNLLGCSNAEIRNAYDNTILYTDYMLARLIDLLQDASAEYDTAMLYVSDHGESLGENGLYLHGLPHAIAPDTQTRVPMVFWMSDAFARRTRIDGACLAGATSAAYSHDNLFASVLGLLDVETSVYEPRKDIFGPCRRDAGVVTARLPPSGSDRHRPDAPGAPAGGASRAVFPVS